VSSESNHPRDEIQDLLDGRLDGSERARVERHLEECEECRREWRTLARVKSAAATALKAKDVPSELAAQTVAALDREDRPEEPRRTSAVLAGRWRPAAALALAAAVAAIAFLLARDQKSASVPDAVARDYAALRAGKLHLQIGTGEPRALERFFAARGIGFETNVFDLGMMGYRLIGGRVHTVRGRPSALFVYRGEQNKILVCQMFEGSARDLPQGAEMRRHGGISFFVYRRDARTLVFWAEGQVLCVLTSDADGEEVIALAFAKAVPT
jgi:anti-sigma factor RsiW